MPRIICTVEAAFFSLLPGGVSGRIVTPIGPGRNPRNSRAGAGWD
jgi:hypothetical protein